MAEKKAKDYKALFKPAPEISRTYKKIQKAVNQAIGQFQLIDDGDRICVAMSGGKDSYTLFHFLLDYQRRSIKKFELFPVTVSTGFGEFKQNCLKIETFLLETYGQSLHVIDEDFETIIKDNLTEKTSSCSFCARLRRGTLQTYCRANGINKIALGHHADDVIESLLMSQLTNGSLWTQAPKYVSNKEITIIRPLFFTFEQDIVSFRDYMKFAIIQCNCPYQGDPQHLRAVTKKLILQIREKLPDCKNSLLKCSVQCYEQTMRQGVKDDEK